MVFPSASLTKLSAESWNIWNDEENSILKALVHMRYGGVNNEFLSWGEIARLMNDRDDLGWGNNGRIYNDLILRFHWQNLKRRTAENAEREAEKGKEKEKEKEQGKDKIAGEKALEEA